MEQVPLNKTPIYGISKLFIAIAAALALSVKGVSAAARDPQTARPVHAVATASVGFAWVNEYVNLVLPVITLLATLLAIIWYAVTIYESKTIQEWIANIPQRRAARHLLKTQKVTAVALVGAEPQTPQTVATAVDLVNAQADTAKRKRLWDRLVLIWPARWARAHNTEHDLRWK
jgi:hypothetical protein